MIPPFCRFVLESKVDPDHPDLADLSPELKFEISHGIVDSAALMGAAAAGEVDIRVLVELGMVGPENFNLPLYGDYEDVYDPDMYADANLEGDWSIVRHLGFPREIYSSHMTPSLVAESEYPYREIVDRFLVLMKEPSPSNPSNLLYYYDVRPDLKPDWEEESKVWNLEIDGLPISLIKVQFDDIYALYATRDFGRPKRIRSGDLWRPW